MTDNPVVNFEAVQEPDAKSFRITFVAETGPDTAGRWMAGAPTSAAVLNVIEEALSAEGLVPVAAQCLTQDERSPYLYQVYKRSDDLWAWRVKSTNGQIVAEDMGQGYENKGDAADMLAKLFGARLIEEVDAIS